MMRPCYSVLSMMAMTLTTFSRVITAGTLTFLEARNALIFSVKDLFQHALVQECQCVHSLILSRWSHVTIYCKMGQKGFNF